MEWLIIAAVLLFILTRKRDPKKKEEVRAAESLFLLLKEVREEDEKDSSEAGDVERKVSAVRKDLWRAKVPQLFDRITQDLIYYPSWLENGPEYVCSLITSAERKQYGKAEITDFTLREKRYSMKTEDSTFSTPDGEYHTHQLMEIYQPDGPRLIALTRSKDYEDEFPEWETFQIEAFKRGPWLEDFRALDARIIEEKREKEEKNRNDPDRLENLKRDFDLED